MSTTNENKEEIKSEKKCLEYLRVRLDDSLIPTSKSKEKKLEKLSDWSNKGYRFWAVDKIQGDGDEFIAEYRTNNHLFNAFIYAYNHHRPLVLRADDLLLAIAMTVAKFIDLDPEAVRACFLSTEGKSGDKKKLEVYQPEENWPKFIEMMDDAIKKSMTTNGKLILDAITNNFSTTTDVSRSVSQIQIMSAMKNYCSYGFMMGCGMSEVMMLGSVRDWENLGAKYCILKTAIPQLSWWYRWMDIIIDMFVGMRKLGVTSELPPYPPVSGDVPLPCGLRSWYQEQNTSSVAPENVPVEYKEIWKRVVSKIPQGSGGQSHLGGWLHMLAPYSADGESIVDEKTTSYSPLMPSVEAPPEKSPNGDFYGHQDTLHKFYKGRDWVEVPKSISAVTASTDFMGDVSVESGFYGVVEHTIPGLDIPGVRAICGYRISAAKDNKDDNNVMNDD